MRSMYIAATALSANQKKLDITSNNLANVNTTGFKKQEISFSDLMYTKSGVSLNKDNKPIPLQIGTGTLVASTAKNFSMGSLEETGQELDLAIEGEGFFSVKDNQGKILYSRDGNLKLSLTEDNKLKITDNNNNSILNTNNEEIILEQKPNKINIDNNGNITVLNPGADIYQNIGTLKIVDFKNRQGLENKGNNLYTKTTASGEELTEDLNIKVRQGFKEGSNVNVIDEMISMMTAQRAYEVNSKIIQVADRMMEMANQIMR